MVDFKKARNNLRIKALVQKGLKYDADKEAYVSGTKCITMDSIINCTTEKWNILYNETFKTT